jgi:hypothetical protein
VLGSIKCDLHHPGSSYFPLSLGHKAEVIILALVDMERFSARLSDRVEEASEGV